MFSGWNWVLEPTVRLFRLIFQYSYRSLCLCQVSIDFLSFVKVWFVYNYGLRGLWLGAGSMIHPRTSTWSVTTTAYRLSLVWWSPSSTTSRFPAPSVRYSILRGLRYILKNTGTPDIKNLRVTRKRGKIWKIKEDRGKKERKLKLKGYNKCKEAKKIQATRAREG